MSAADKLVDEADRLKDQGQLDAAVAKLREALALDPAHVMGNLMLSKTFNDLKKYPEAIEAGKKAIELEPNSWFNYMSLSIVYRNAGMIPEAEHMRDRSHMLRAQT